MRHLTALLLVATALALTPGRAGAQAPSTETTRVVASTADYLDAVADLSADDSGPHTIRLDADLQLAEGDHPLYEGTQPLTIDGQGHTIRGAGARSQTSVVRVSGKALLTVEDLTVRNAGSAVGSDGSIVVRRSRFSGMGHTAVSAFGHQPPGLVIVSGSRFVANQSGLGGGGQVRATGRVIVTTSTFQGNRSRNFSATAYAIHDVRIERSTISGNFARAGAIVFSSRGNVELVNSTVTGNRGYAIGSTGGGVIQSPQRVTLDHTTISGNRMAGDRRGSSAVVANQLVSRSSVIQNRVADCSIGDTTTSSGSRASDRSCGFTGPNDGVLADPGLGALADNGGPTLTQRPVAGSPLRNAVGCRSAVPIDQRGVRRPIGARCDIGAVESR